MEPAYYFDGEELLLTFGEGKGNKVTADLVLSIGKETIWLVLIIGAPLLGLGLIVGIAVAIFQAATQINEMTLTFVPKIVAVLLALLIFFPWMMRTLIEFTVRLYTNIPFYIK